MESPKSSTAATATTKTTEPVKAATRENLEAEFLRVPQVQKIYGIRRGICYRKIKDGTFKSVLLREPGNKTGIRLIFSDSVRKHLHSIMESGNEGDSK